MTIPGRSRRCRPRPPEDTQPVDRDAAQPAAERSLAQVVDEVRQLAHQHAHHLLRQVLDVGAL
jgi:hypothetical protein